MFKTTVQVLRRTEGVAHTVMVRTRTFLGIVIHRAEHLVSIV